MDNSGGQSYDGAVNMAGSYAGALTLIQHQFVIIILFLDKCILVETSHTNSWVHPCLSLKLSHTLKRKADDSYSPATSNQYFHEREKIKQRKKRNYKRRT